jgi:c-di-GMP-related signal transduction protein
MQFVNQSNKRENYNRKEHVVGDEVLLRRGTENNYEDQYQSPFAIL